VDHCPAADGFILEVYPLHKISCRNIWYLQVGFYKQSDFKSAAKKLLTTKCISEFKMIVHIRTFEITEFIEHTKETRKNVLTGQDLTGFKKIS
jgi:hypothetical protein